MIKKPKKTEHPILQEQEFKKIIAVDFDGTLCTNAYPRIGIAREAIIQSVKDAKADGCAIILWTCRTGKELQEAIQWSAEHGVVFDAINSNLPSHIAKYGEDSRKIFAHVYLDDRAYRRLMEYEPERII